MEQYNSFSTLAFSPVIIEVYHNKSVKEFSVCICSMCT